MTSADTPIVPATLNSPDEFCFDSADGLEQTPIQFPGGNTLLLKHRQCPDGVLRRVNSAIHDLTAKRRADEIPALFEKEAKKLIVGVAAKTRTSGDVEVPFSRIINGTKVIVTTDTENWKDLLPAAAVEALANSLFRTPEVTSGK